MRVYLAPMEGVVDHVIRDLFTQIGGYDQCVTEFVRVTDKLLPNHTFYRYCPELHHEGELCSKTSSGTPVYIQLLGSDPQVLAENAAKAVELGAAGIDLNFGCPAKTVNRHDGGASLLKNPERLFAVISAVKGAVNSAPVTAKVRLGFEDKNLSTEIAQAVDRAKADRLTVHARTKLEGYKPPAHWHYIAQMREAVSIPVVANGDIWSADDYHSCVETSGCEDVAIGRSAFARPDLANLIKETSERPLSWEQIKDPWFSKFLQMSLESYGENFALPRGKQWLKFLGRHFPEAESEFARLKRLQTFEEFQQELLAPNR